MYGQAWNWLMHNRQAPVGTLVSEFFLTMKREEKREERREIGERRGKREEGRETRDWREKREKRDERLERRGKRGEGRGNLIDLTLPIRELGSRSDPAS